MNEVLGVRHTAPDFTPPPGACDCHVHVFGPRDRFPYDPGRGYTPNEASADTLLAHQKALGLDRVVVVQPSVYGTDNACTLDALRQLGDRARGVAVTAPGLDKAALRELHRAGIRGIRVNLEQAGQSDPAAALPLLQAASNQAAEAGWHLQVYTNLAVLAALHDAILRLPVILVIDHFGRAGGIDVPGFAALRDLVQTGKAYVKLSAAHRLPGPAGQADALAQALIAANPERMLWGSDWPHPGMGSTQEALDSYDKIDDGAALNALRRWAGTDAVAQAILSTNPARLYFT